MPDMVVAKPFLLTLEGREPRFFGVGIHKDVPPEISEHWFAKHHLAKDGKLPEPSTAAPLTNEERLSVKAALDAAEKRAVDAEAEARSVRDAHDGLRAGMDTLAADNEALRSRVASLEADLDKATRPPSPPKPAGAK